MTRKRNLKLSFALFAAGAMTLGLSGLAAAQPAKTRTSKTRVVRYTEITQHTKPAPGHRYGKRGEHHRQHLAKYDWNKNGKLDAREKLAMQRARFSTMDRNRDGRLSLGEMRVATRRHAKPNKPNRFGVPMKRPRTWSRSLAARFKTMDKNGDGFVTFAEFRAAKRSRMGGWHKRPRRPGPRITRRAGN